MLEWRTEEVSMSVVGKTDDRAGTFQHQSDIEAL